MSLRDIGISACLITKNEEEMITCTLGQLSPYVDEIVIVDGNSTDKTEDLAKKFKKIIKRHKNAWVVLSLRKNVMKKEIINSYYFPLLYNKNKVKFIGNVHEKLVPIFSSNKLYCFIRPITRFLLKDRCIVLPPRYVRYHIIKERVSPRKGKYYARLEAKIIKKFAPLYIPPIYLMFVIISFFYFFYVYRKLRVSFLSTRNRFFTLVYIFDELLNTLKNKIKGLLWR